MRTLILCTVFLLPTVVLAGDPVLGKGMYAQYCSACHQADGKGKIGLAPSLNNPDFLAIADNGFIKNTILNGRLGTTMISFSLMPDVTAHIDDLVSFIRSWERDYVNITQVDVDDQKHISGDASQGKQGFKNYCAACHGPNGEGYNAGGSGPGVGRDGFLTKASDDYIKQTIILGRAGTAMRGFLGAQGLANLEEREIDNIVVYLRSLSKQ